MPSHLPPPTLLDLLCRKEVIFNGPMSTEPILSRVLVYLGMQHELGKAHSPIQLAARLGSTCIKFLKLTRKNPYFYRWLVLRPPSSANLPMFQRLVDLHTTAIRCLDLSFCHDYVTDAELKRLAATCPFLTQCVLWGCHDLTDEGIITLASNCPYLTFLNFGACAKVTDVTLERIGSDLMYLDNLHLSGCPLVTDAGIAKLLPSSRVVLQLRQTTDPRPVPSEVTLLHHRGSVSRLVTAV
ncbi:hypothetical protein, variant 1 [Aphanomyces invadans]|uniref:F-box/LRR-repeat protein 15-like leucin rich repeat domain-containing protein n=1 Tax=Aphanomyces invadans TaxID=157072 RepID=A0A024UBL6_9STRA|nr:hypothetical protein, variant 1 [Aphanomyces invadans]ETW03669.1 hypothetical protein, variant 1 [Aphanomyces invadans]|eukprot:XP_008867898.1 hypothetical protein, variant 1 [Aphanomyces invadans]